MEKKLRRRERQGKKGGRDRKEEIGRKRLGGTD